MPPSLYGRRCHLPYVAGDATFRIWQAMRERYTGANSGARVWYDAVDDEVHWPVVLLYPETSRSDFIQVTPAPIPHPLSSW